MVIKFFFIEVVLNVCNWKLVGDIGGKSIDYCVSDRGILCSGLRLDMV